VERQERTTLGDILYGNGARGGAREKDWVELVHAVAGGNQVALRSLWDQTHRLVYTLAVRLTRNRATAEEVTVDVFHDVWRRAAAYDPADGSVIGWIMNQARSRAIDRVRFEQRKKRINPLAENPVEPSPAPDPLATLDLDEQGRMLREALAVLGPAERQAIEAAFFSELTYPEVATRLDQPLGTIKTRIRSGLRKLRTTLANGDQS
jgi:RNA polymerase sigma-70 factor (ECF subfamily)